VGTLTCSPSFSIGLVIGSQRNVSCLSRGAPSEPDEPYTGTMTRVRLDIAAGVGSLDLHPVVVTLHHVPRRIFRRMTLHMRLATFSEFTGE
jgi:hypothetical protein